MKTRYRIKQRYYSNGSTDFEVQKKVWFLPFWYNFENVDGHITGFYSSIEEAKEAIEENKYRVQSVIHYVLTNNKNQDSSKSSTDSNP